MTDTTVPANPATPRSTTSTDELAALTSGSGMWTTTALPGAIRSLVLSDGPHGLRRQPQAGGDNLGIGSSLPSTCFPTASALGSSWNPALLRRVGQALGAEARALGVDVLLGPGLNIKRSPLGGRNFEYFSEDPLISGVLAGAMVDGIQSEGVAATPKHFAVNNQETDRMRVDAQVDEVALREVYLSGFERVVTQHRPWAIMSSYNKINGVFASENPWLLTTVLRDEWGFDGLVMSDWSAVNDRVAAVAAGLDLEMPPTDTDHRIAAAVADGTLDIAVLERVRERLALLAARTHRGTSTDSGAAGAGPAGAADDATLVRGGDGVIAPDVVADHDALARQAAAESLVLLKNDGVLPLAVERLAAAGGRHRDGAARGTIAVIGGFATAARYQGGGSSSVVPTVIHQPLDELRAVVGDRAEVVFSEGFSTTATEITDAERALADAAVETARSADVVVLFLAQPAGVESEGFDRTSLELPAVQRDLVARLAELDVPVVATVAGGGSVELGAIDAACSAVLITGLSGQAGAGAVADVLVGAVNPSGHLAETYVNRLVDTPSYPTFPGRDSVAHYGEGRLVGYRYFDALGLPVAYPFGHGLSYTEFSFTDIEVAATGHLAWEVSVTVTNVGQMAGAAVPQLYVCPPALGDGPAVHELRGFTKEFLEPGQSRRVTLPLESRDLARWSVRDQRWSVAAGTYRIEVGASSRDISLTASLHTDGDGWIPVLDEWSTVAEWAAHPFGSALMEHIRTRIPASAGGSDSNLVAMFMQLPVMKLISWPLGITEQILAEMCRDAAARRAAIIAEHGEAVQR